MPKKIPRLEKKETVTCINGYLENNSLDDIISHLQSLRDTYKNKYSALTVETECFYDGPAEIVIYGWTIESDKEYAARVAIIKEKEQKERELKKQRKIELERAERETYERLKKKFES